MVNTLDGEHVHQPFEFPVEIKVGRVKHQLTGLHLVTITPPDRFRIHEQGSKISKQKFPSSPLSLQVGIDRMVKFVTVEHLADIQNVVEKAKERSGATTDLGHHVHLLRRKAVVAQKDVQETNHRGHWRTKLMAATIPIQAQR
jgi:hypothetical protein